MEEHGAAEMFEKNGTIFMNPAGKVNGLPNPRGSVGVGSDPMSHGWWPPLADSFIHTFPLKKSSTSSETRRVQTFTPRNRDRRTIANCLAVADDN